MEQTICRNIKKHIIEIAFDIVGRIIIGFILGIFSFIIFINSVFGKPVWEDWQAFLLLVIAGTSGIIVNLLLFFNPFFKSRWISKHDHGDTSLDSSLWLYSYCYSMLLQKFIN
jgi:hypothetical protein